LFYTLSLIRLRRDFFGLCTLSESILETTSHALHVPHSSGSCCATTLGFFSPVVTSHFLGWVSARGAALLLDMKGDFATTTARCVRLIVSLSEGGGTFGL
jgi:hypothetical protein